jgi:hypothetical protein
MISRDEFYNQRDRSTRHLGVVEDVVERPVGVIVSSTAADSRSGQVAAIALVNMIARVHRRIQLVVPPAPLIANPYHGGTNLAEALQNTILAIDPFNEVSVVQSVDAVPAISIGTERTAGAWQIAAHGSRAILKNDSSEFPGTDGSVLGAGLAACLGAAALFRLAHGLGVNPHVVSAWNFSEGTEAVVGPLDMGPLDVGDVLIVGAGAVCSALSYWLRVLGTAGKWDVIDKDHVTFDNTSRGLGMFAGDAGWNDSTPARKVDLIARDIGATPHFAWYDEWVKDHDEARPDLVLPLANERDVRHLIACRYDPIVLHATTSQSWQAQFHRHINGIDDCITCRMRDLRGGTLDCSTGTFPASDGQSRDAALPFLSAAAGLLLTSSLYRLAEGDLTAHALNHFCLDLSLGHRLVQAGIWNCKDTCVNRVSAVALGRIAEGTRWSNILSLNKSS